jgi:hypothetical protein
VCCVLVFFQYKRAQPQYVHPTTKTGVFYAPNSVAMPGLDLALEQIQKQISDRYGPDVAAKTMASFQVRVYPLEGKLPYRARKNMNFTYNGFYTQWPYFMWRAHTVIGFRQTQGDKVANTGLAHEVSEHALSKTLDKGVNSGHTDPELLAFTKEIDLELSQKGI